MVAQINEQGQGNLISYTVPGLKVDGPVIANRSMLADPVVAETTTLLGQRGSGVKLGNMLLIPLEGNNGEEDVLLYLRPMYVEASILFNLDSERGSFGIERSTLGLHEDTTSMFIQNF